MAEIAPNYRGLVFDFDGTLVDLNVDWVSLRYALAQAFPHSWFQKLGIREGMNQLAEAELPAAFDLIRQFELAHDATFKPLFESLEEWHQAGKKMAIFTANTQATVAKAMGPHAHYFSAFICGDQVANRKPNPEGLTTAIQKMGLRPREILYIADGEAEITTAYEAGVDFYRV